MSKIVAHRGASHEKRENTLAAIQTAIAMGADFVEIDVHITQDGVVVCHHDAFLQSGLAIADHSLIELQASFAELPTLDAILALPFGQTGLMVELKAGKRPLVTAVLKCLQSDVAMPLILGSFSPEIMKELSTQWPLEQLIGIAETSEELTSHKVLGPGYLALDKALATVETIHQLQASGFKVWVWTVDDLALATTLMQADVDGIITNEPRSML